MARGKAKMKPKEAQVPDWLDQMVVEMYTKMEKGNVLASPSSSRNT